MEMEDWEEERCWDTWAEEGSRAGGQETAEHVL